MFRFYLIILLNLFRAPYYAPRIIYMKRHKEAYTPEQCHRLARKIVRIIKRTGNIYTKAYGTENLPTEGGYVMFPNHQGKYDPLGIFYTHDRPCSFVMDELRSHAPLTSQILDLTGGKRMKINDVRQAMTIINEITEEVKQGKIFVIFPEGGYFHNHNTVKAFKPGSFKSAMRAKAPIVPVAIYDSYKAFEGFHFGRIKTQVHYLKPLFAEDYEGLNTTQVAEIVRNRIIEKITEIEDSIPKLKGKHSNPPVTPQPSGAQ